MKKTATNLTTKSAASLDAQQPISLDAEKLGGSLFVTRYETAQMLGCSVSTVDALTRAGLLQRVNGAALIAMTDVVRVLRRGKPWQGTWRACK